MLLRAPRPSKSCISIDKQYNQFRRWPCWPSNRPSPSSSARLALARGKLEGLHFSLFLHRRDAFHRGSIGYSELEVVAASSQRQSEFLCAEACHTPIEDAIFSGRLRGNTHLENTGFRNARFTQSGWSI